METDHAFYATGPRGMVCLPCRTAHKRCDGSRPCARCVTRNIADQCVDPTEPDRRPNRTRRHSAGGVEPQPQPIPRQQHGLPSSSSTLSTNSSTNSSASPTRQEDSTIYAAALAADIFSQLSLSIRVQVEQAYPNVMTMSREETLVIDQRNEESLASMGVLPAAPEFHRLCFSLLNSYFASTPVKEASMKRSSSASSNSSRSSCSSSSEGSERLSCMELQMEEVSWSIAHLPSVYAYVHNIALDVNTRPFIVLSPTFQRMFGWTQDVIQAAGVHAPMIAHQDDLPAAIAAMAMSLLQTPPSELAAMATVPYVRILKADGSFIPCAIESVIWRAENLCPVYLFTRYFVLPLTL